MNDAEFVNTIKEDYRKASLNRKEMTILKYASKLTNKPASIEDKEVYNLREVGCTDLEILDICQIISFFNFINRIAEGLGVKLEDEYINN